MDHLESSNILCPQQHGFREYRSCETQLLEFMEEVSAAMESGTPTDVIIMEFAKAFDPVKHSLLVHKLNHFGIRGNTNSWIANFLHDREQAVVVECQVRCSTTLCPWSMPFSSLHHRPAPQSFFSLPTICRRHHPVPFHCLCPRLNGTTAGHQASGEVGI